MVPSLLSFVGPPSFSLLPYPPFKHNMVAAGLLVLSLFSLALGAPTAESSSGYHVLRSRADTPKGFTWRQKANSEQMLSLRIALVQNNATGLESALYDVSNPKSENYGHHLSKAEVRFSSSITEVCLGKPHRSRRSSRWSPPSLRVSRRSRRG